MNVYLLNLAIIIVALLLSAAWGLCIDFTAAESDSPQITTYVVPPISNDKILPDTSISSDYITNEISLRASRGEFQPASFVIHSNEDITDLQVSTTDLISGNNSISPENLDIRIVKCWYQAGYDITDSNHKHLTPELLLKDDSLIKVENEENYLKLTNGTYMWISDPTPVPKYQRYTIDEIPVMDAQSLQPVDIPANTNKQFWITLNVPINTPPGFYTGNIELRTPTGLLDQINLTLEVLPFELSRPMLTYSIYYYGILNADRPQGSIGPRFKSEAQLRAELKNLYDHGVSNPMMLQYPSDETRLRRHLEIRNELGIDRQPLYYRGLDNLDSMDKVPIAEHIMEIASEFGISEVYFYGRDEALTESVEWLTSQRPVWEAVRQLGGKIYASGVRVNHFSPPRDPGNFGFMGDIQDLLICHGPPSAEEAANWHGVDHKIFCYSNPQVGEEKPETYRRNFGLLLWQNNYDGAMNYAYNEDWGNPWNDFDYNIRGHMFAYYTIDGVIDTIQWEGWREAVTDVRYLSTLLEVIEAAKSEGKDTSNAEAWLTDLKNSNLTTQNLDSIRSQMIDHILNLRINHPPVLDAIGNKSVNEGQPLQFTISATDPDGDILTYSANNLPSGATFTPFTRTFAWTPSKGQAGIYPNIQFQISDGSLTDSEEISISVSSVPSGNGGGGEDDGTVIINFKETISPEGRLTVDVRIASKDSRVSLDIAKGTICKDVNDSPLSWVSVRALSETEQKPDVRENSVIISKYYGLDPPEANFNPPIKLTFEYESSLLPEWADTGNLYIGAWDRKKGDWVQLESHIEPEKNIIWTEITQFSTYIIIAEPRHTNWRLIIGVIAVCTILLVLLVLYLVARK